MDREIRNDVNASNFVSEGRWPVSFVLTLPQPSQAEAARGKPVWFSYDLYRGPRNRKPELLYAKTREESESVAYYKFLEEPHRILGFDLEWPCYITDDQRAPLQHRVGLITIASEDKVALFHIGAHDGNTYQELIAPSLRSIIESDDFIKVGVNILSADFERLRKWFGLRPQGAVELSHLHNLITAGDDQLGSCTTKLCSLEKQVKLHLDLPLDKGNSRVRTSNWSRKVLSKEQRLYAANDAYASLMLYHYLEARRLAMDPVPPQLLWHERYGWFQHIPGRKPELLLQLDDEVENDGFVKVVKVSDWSASDCENVYCVDRAKWHSDLRPLAQ